MAKNNNPHESVEQLRETARAAIADLEMVCENVNTCLACAHFQSDKEKPSCELMGWKCEWTWRGVK